MKETLEFEIDKQKAVQTGTFFVPAGCERFYLTHDLTLPYTLLVYLLLRAPDGTLRFQKQLGYSEPVICMGQNGRDTTIGGIPGALLEGSWSVELYVFSEYAAKLTETIPFTVTVTDLGTHRPLAAVGDDIWADTNFVYRHLDKTRIQNGKKGWYKGDLHTHTQLSDGKELPARAMEKAGQMALDYYVATEHNLLHTGWQETSVLVMPGVELTTNLGHANLFGLDRRPASLTRFFHEQDTEKIRQNFADVLSECRARGWLFSINHPFLQQWRWRDDAFLLTQLDCLEIINDPTYRDEEHPYAAEANRAAVFFCDLLWADGYRPCAIGGSDSHNRIDEYYPQAAEPSVPGDPATWLFMDGLSEEHVLEALRACRCYVTRHCAITAELTVKRTNGAKDPLCFGDRIPEDGEQLTAGITVRGTKEAPEIFYVRDGKRMECGVQKTPEGDWLAFVRIPLTKDGYQWIRFGAESADGDFLFYANPLTKGSKEHAFHTFGELRKELERQWQ